MPTPGDKFILKVPDPLPDWAQDVGLEIWRGTLKRTNGKSGQVVFNTGLGYCVKVESDQFYVPEDWLKITETAACFCTSRDLLTFGHRCGRKAPVDRK